MTLKFDIAIVGAGLTGNSLALALAKLGFKIALIDPKAFSSLKNLRFDTRNTALSKKTMLFYKKIGFWKLINNSVCAIENIIVNNGNSKKNISFKKNNGTKNNNTLGFMIENKILSKQLIISSQDNKNIYRFDSKLSKFDREKDFVLVRLEDKTIINCKLIIGADGKKSLVRKLACIEYFNKNYNQKAFIFNIKHEKKHNNIAIENFLEQGPLASLPLKSQNSNFYSSIVWSYNKPNYFKFLKLSNKEIEKILNFHLSELLGKIKINSSIKSWDLSLVQSNQYIAHRLLLIGDAAHSIHPLAGQGFNLTMRGIETIYQMASGLKKKDEIGNFKNLNIYNNKQYLDSKAIIFATDKLNFLFSNSNFFLKNARNAGIFLFSKTSFFRNIFRNYASEGKISLK